MAKKIKEPPFADWQIVLGSDGGYSETLTVRATSLAVIDATTYLQDGHQRRRPVHRPSPPPSGTSGGWSRARTCQRRKRNPRPQRPPAVLELKVRPSGGPPATRVSSR